VRLHDFAESVPVQINGSVPNEVVVHRAGCNRISQRSIEGIAVEKFKSCGLGITFEDIQIQFRVKKPPAQRSLKHFHDKGVLFTAQPLIRQGIFLIQNTNPQQYFPSCIRAEIIENLKNRNDSVSIEPTGVNLTNGTLNQRSSSKRASSSNLENQKARSFLDVLLRIPFVPLYMHKLQLMTCIDKEYYNHQPQKEVPINRAKCHAENVGRRHVKYTLYPNDTVEIAINSSDTPFRIETDDDELRIFSFLGQDRDRLLYVVRDPKERHVLSMMQWILKACDLNRDVKVADICQLTLSDIQLKTAAKVFRIYIKSLKDRIVCRAEESLKLDVSLPEALDNIRYPYKSIESKLSKILQIVQRNEEHSPDNSLAQSAKSNEAVGGQ
jgi:hypothetical protein